MVLDNSKSKTKAAASQADAEVKRLESELSTATTRLRLVRAGDAAIDKLTNVPVSTIKDNTEFLRKKTESELAAAQATVDKLQAELDAANSKLKWARSADRSVNAVSDTLADIKEEFKDSAKSSRDDYRQP